MVRSICLFIKYHIHHAIGKLPHIVNLRVYIFALHVDCIFNYVILTFGDSNTHGTPPMTDRITYARYDAATRWPQVMARTLGWDLVEEGLPGRTAQFDDPCMDGLMNGYPALRQALQSHGPLDVLTVMLGTNDVKTRFGASAEAVMGNVEEAVLASGALEPVRQVSVGAQATGRIVSLKVKLGDNVATGVGVQLNINGAPLSVNNSTYRVFDAVNRTTVTNPGAESSYTIFSNPDNPGGAAASNSLTFTTNYYKTGSEITPGTANASGTITFSYN